MKARRCRLELLHRARSIEPKLPRKVHKIIKTTTTEAARFDQILAGRHALLMRQSGLRSAADVREQMLFERWE